MAAIAVSLADAGLDYGSDWWMHFHFPTTEDAASLWSSNVEIQKSEVQQQHGAPDPGEGLFAAVDMKEKQLVCEFPGKWTISAFETMIRKHGEYVFSLTDAWPKLSQELLLYRTLDCQANKLNSATFKKTVHTSSHLPMFFFVCCFRARA